MNEHLNLIETPQSGRITFPLEGMPLAEMMQAIWDEGGNSGRLVR